MRKLPVASLLIAFAGSALSAYWLAGQTWPTGSIVPTYIQLGASPQLIDGCPDWSCVAMSAISDWNGYLGNIQLQGIPNAAQASGESNKRNDMFFAADVYGDSFDANTLATTVYWYRGDRLVEGDVVFNSAKRWDSYRGPTRFGSSGRVYDLRRVAVHELGHVLGLGHPDEHGQNVVALMNSFIGDMDDLAADDIAGISSLYGGGSGGSGASIPFPPRNETYDFRSWLEAKYRNDLGRGQGPSYADVEGAVVWTQEYLRYRLNACSHDQAVQRIRMQIGGGGVPPVCGTPPSTTVIAFPPRDETYGFRLQLEDIYRDDLKRDAVQTAVDSEGDVVWIQEYLRYRLNRCTHAQSVDKVNAQIDGRGVQPVCR